MVTGWSSFIWFPHRCGTLAANPRTSGEQPSIVRLFGISARKVYPCSLLPIFSVGSYPTFSPLPFARRLFSVALSMFHFIETPSVRWCAALSCPDFPPLRTKAITQFVITTNLTKKKLIKQLL